MRANDALKNMRSSDVEIGLNPLKRLASSREGWVCERCGATKTGATKPKSDEAPVCKSKAATHKWRPI